MNAVKSFLLRPDILILGIVLAIGGTIRCDRDDDDDKKSAASTVMPATPPINLSPPDLEGTSGVHCEGAVRFYEPQRNGDPVFRYTHDCTRK